MSPIIHTLDLDFQGMGTEIAAYLIPHAQGALLVECGPGSTLPALQARLQELGLTIKAITDVFLTHIHLDHAGAAGWLSRQGARIHVHGVGAPHLVNPEKLIASAARIYGDRMQSLWGEFLSVPEERLSVLQDEAVVEVGGVSVQALETPGHAYHHFCYVIGNTCFTGDVGGMRSPGVRHIHLPMPPPELHFETWRSTLGRLQGELAAGRFQRVAPTHFGIYDDAAWHLDATRRTLDAAQAWMEKVMPADPTPDELRQQFAAYERQRTIADGYSAEWADAYEKANPSGMSADGIARYWKKYRSAT